MSPEQATVGTVAQYWAHSPDNVVPEGRSGIVKFSNETFAFVDYGEPYGIKATRFEDLETVSWKSTR